MAPSLSRVLLLGAGLGPAPVFVPGVCPSPGPLDLVFHSPISDQ